MSAPSMRPDPHRDNLPGQDKVIERVGLGSYVYSYDGDAGSWGEVTAVLSGNYTPSGRKVTELRVKDATGVYGLRDWNNETVRWLSKAEAKRLGLDGAS